MPSMVWTIISFLIIFTVVVVSHEFGHFIIGRLNGINVEEFTIGMGPAIFKKKGKHTTFAIRLLPIGGACVFQGMFAEDEEKENKDEVFAEKDNKDEVSAEKEIKEEVSVENRFREGDFGYAPVWGRIATIVAGPLFNVILAFFLSMIIVWFCGSDLPVIYDVTDNLPAKEAGFQAGDKIVRINGENIYLWREVCVISMLNSGTPLDITYERDGKTYEATVNPAYSSEDDRYYIGFLGHGEQIDCNINHI